VTNVKDVLVPFFALVRYSCSLYHLIVHMLCHTGNVASILSHLCVCRYIQCHIQCIVFAAVRIVAGGGPHSNHQW